jgi:hypothetical protein
MKGAVKHRLSRHPIYTCWQHMKYRCLVPSNSAYEYYGGRGITVCERWLHFPNFYEDMYPTWVKGLSIERVDNSKGYSPDNCVWASQKQQMRNTRRNRYVDTPDGQMCLRDAETAYGIMEDTLRVRIDAGVSAEMLLTKGKVYHGRTRKKG